MISWIVTFVVAMAASLCLTALVRTAARRWRIVDHPDGRRKLHSGPVPLWGGIAVYLAVVLGLVTAVYGPFGAGQQQVEFATTLIITAGIVCLFGSVDDCWGLGSRLKLLLQIGAVLPIVALGCSVDRIAAFGHPIELGWLGPPLTVLWLVACINALNLLDGMDGLASTVGLVTAVMMAIIAASGGHVHVAVTAVVLAGALAGFLVYNLPPASIFLGDSGSMVIGLIVGVLGIQGALKTSATLAITVPAVIMCLPMFDMLLAVVRRKLTGERFDAADRQHVHHRLLDRGLNPWQVLCVIGAFCLITGAAAVVASFIHFDALAWITALALIVLAVRMELFGHHELALVKRAVACRLADVASRLGAPPSRLSHWDAAKLADLPFVETWQTLIDEVKTRSVRRLELILSCEGEHPRRHHWVSDASCAGDVDTQGRWSIAMAFHNRRQQVCELRATGTGGTDSQIPDTEGLNGVLTAFAAHFANHAEQIPGRAPLGEAATRSPHGRRPQAKTA